MKKLGLMKKHFNSKTLFQIVRRGIEIGFCPICEKKTIFFKRGNWWRDHYHCLRCLSVPRNRALFHLLQGFFPNWRELHIHESSPSGSTFDKLSSECLNYVPTQYFPNIPLGTMYLGFRCEDLSRQTFDDESFDIVITQDVLEHLLEPTQSIKEICRTLKPGGVHIFTVPWYYWKETKIRARKIDGEIKYIEQPEYHANPVDEKGALVVTEWGKDLIDTVYASSGMTTTAIRIHDRQIGVEANFIEVFLSRKLSYNLKGLTNRWSQI